MVFRGRREAVKRMENAWKILAHTPQRGGGRGTLEYFLVRAPDPDAALSALRAIRIDLLDAELEARGEASESLVGWLQPDKAVFSIVVLS